MVEWSSHKAYVGCSNQPGGTINFNSMKFIRQYLEKELKLSPLGELKLGEMEEIPGTDYFNGQELIIDNKHTGLYVGIEDYCYWLEKYVTEADIEDGI